MKHTRLIGVDISDASLKVLQLSNDGVILAYGTALVPSGVIENGRIVNKEAFAAALKGLLQQTKPNVLLDGNSIIRTVLCLPESKLFTHSLVIPEGTKRNDMRRVVEEEARKIIPYELERMYWDFHTAVKLGKTFATFVGVAKSDLDNFVEAFSSAHAQPAFIGGELFALGHALLEDQFKGNCIVVDMGQHSTTIGLFAADVMPDMSVVVPCAGDSFTQAIATKLGVGMEEAEKQKRMYGVLSAHEKTGVPGELRTCLKQITDEVKAMKSFFEKRYELSIDHIVLSGGSALLPGIVELMQEETGIASYLADPLVKVKGHEVLGSGTPGILFANVIGLALYAKQKRRGDINLLGNYRYEEGEAKKELPSIQDIRSLGDLYYFLYSNIQNIRNFLDDRSDSFKKKVTIPVQLILSLLFLAATLVFLGWVMLTYM